MDNKYCYQCKRWKYNISIERKYGEGTGICGADGEAKGCNRRACLLFEEGDDGQEDLETWNRRAGKENKAE